MSPCHLISSHLIASHPTPYHTNLILHHFNSRFEVTVRNPLLSSINLATYFINSFQIVSGWYVLNPKSATVLPLPTPKDPGEMRNICRHTVDLL